jgi:hypothetical protein
MLPLTAPLAEVDPNTVRPGWVALLIVLALAVATFLLWRNMGKQMRKIDFDETYTDPAGGNGGNNSGGNGANDGNGNEAGDTKRPGGERGDDASS